MKPILVHDKLLFNYKEIKINIPACQICVVIDRFPLSEEEIKKEKEKIYKEYSIAVSFYEKLKERIEDFRFKYEKLNGKGNEDLSRLLKIKLLDFFAFKNKKTDYILLQENNEKILEIFCDVLKNIEP